MERSSSPYIAHIFVCVNDRGGVRQACADGDNLALKDRLKEAVAARGWKPRVRVSQCGCLGVCAQGPNVMIYPQAIWFQKVELADLDRILAELEALLSASS